MVNCSAFGCLNRSEHKSVSFHRFPKDSRRNLWIANMRLEKNWSPTRNDRLCSEHFDAKFLYKTNSTTRLLAKAVPTIFKTFPPYLQPIQDIKCLQEVAAQEEALTNSPGQASIVPELDTVRQMKVEDS